MPLIIAFIIGFIVATVGWGNLANYADKQTEKAKEVIRENVK